MYFFREREREEERGRETSMYERYIDQLHLTNPQLGNLARNPGTCPDWESNQQSFDSQTGTQSTEPHQPRLENTLYSHIS